MQRKWYLEGADALVWRFENVMTDKKEDPVNMEVEETQMSAFRRFWVPSSG